MPTTVRADVKQRQLCCKKKNIPQLLFFCLQVPQQSADFGQWCVQVVMHGDQGWVLQQCDWITLVQTTGCQCCLFALWNKQDWEILRLIWLFGTIYKFHGFGASWRKNTKWYHNSTIEVFQRCSTELSPGGDVWKEGTPATKRPLVCEGSVWNSILY